MHDLVIDNAVVYDGLGHAPTPGGVAVSGGRIAAVGGDLGPARERVDAGGLALAPGIVDIHTHYDAQLTWDPFATPSTALGVTTVVIGNCGFTIAPCRPDDRDLTLRALTHVEGMSLDALRAGVRWEFETYPQFLEAMERRGVVPNVASFVGHSSVRTYVLGADATKRAATTAEIAEMRRLVLEAVRAGAVGFATSTLEQHNGENGIPMPSRLADEAELLALTGALGEAGRGVFMLTKGMTSSIPWLEKVAAASGRPVMIAAMFVDPGDPTRVFRELGEIEAACGRRRALRRRRPSVVPLRRRLRPPPVRPLGARARRPDAAGGGQARHERRGLGVSHPRARAAGAGRVGGPAAVRPGHRRPRAQAARQRPADRRHAPGHAGRRRPRRLGQRRAHRRRARRAGRLRPTRPRAARVQRLRSDA